MFFDKLQYFCNPASRVVDAGVATMGSKMLLLGLMSLLIGALAQTPTMEMRANFEYDERSTNLAEPAYRLEDSVYPTHMNVDLDVYLSELRFNGLVQMIVEVREANLTQIVMHQKVVSIQAVSIVNADTNAAVALAFPDPFTTDDYFELLKINLADVIPVGRYIITVSYTGQINNNPVDRGFYSGYYYLGNELRTYATTQFQPYHARKAFPCFDEPQFKSVYVISITRDSNLSQSYSNMDIAETQVMGNRTKETFYPTPIISAYLVAFHVSDFVSTNYTSTDARPFLIISRPGVLDQHPYAADIGLKITNELDDYFSIQYHEMGQGVLMKNDHIALPDFPSGAMENWGMVNYREAYLLYDANNTNIINKIFIATIMAHELGHKWFGNLVTCFWWSNLWLNESYASFFEYFAAHWADPSLELADQFIVDYVHSALAGDASASVAPMNWTAVNNQSTISGHFSTSSYAKGASVLKMMEHFLGERNFRNGLRYYLRDNAYEIGTPEKVYDGFRKAVSEDFQFLQDYPNVDVGAILDTWIQNAGAPVVNVNVNRNTGVITLTQERFQLSGTPATQIWSIPITWTHSGNLNFTSTKPTHIMTGQQMTITHTPGDFFVVLNIAQSGYYRVFYDEENWKMLADYLKSNNRENIHKLNRAQIVNDVLYFIRSGKMGVAAGFEVLSFLEHETDYYVWAAAIGQLDWIHRRLEHLPIPYNMFNTYLLNLMDKVISHLGYNELSTDSTSTILNRMQILNFACNLGHQGCISDSLQKWRAHVENPSNLVPVNLRRYVYCVGLREGDNTDYEFLYQKYNSSENTADMVVILRALACTKNETSFNHYLTQSMYNDRIRIHDKTNAFSFALQGNMENRRLVFNFLYENFNEIRQTYGGNDRLIIAINACAAFLTNSTEINEFSAWAHANQVELGAPFSTALGVVSAARNNINWGNANSVELFNSIATSSSVSFTTPIALLIAAIAIHLFH